MNYWNGNKYVKYSNEYVCVQRAGKQFVAYVDSGINGLTNLVGINPGKRLEVISQLRSHGIKYEEI